MTALRVNESSGSLGSLQVSDGFGGFLSGSLSAGTNITIQNDSNGNFIINSQAVSAPSGLNTQIQFNDNGSFGAESDLTYDKVNKVLKTSGIITASIGFSGSLTRLSDDTSYLIAGSNITIVSQSNGSIVISAKDDNTLYNAGTGLVLDTGVFSVDNSIVATLTGSIFSGEVKFEAGLSGSLTKLTDGSSYLVAGQNIDIVTGSNGQVTISSLGSFGNQGTIQISDGNGGFLSGSIIPGTNITIQDDGSGNFTINSTAGSGAGISAREKYDYNILTTYLSGSEFFVANSDFSAANYDPTLIDVYRNGQLILSGTNSQVGAGEADYFVNSATSIKIGFDLFPDDIISVATYGTDTTINREKYDYELSSTILSGSVLNVSNSDLAGSSYDPTLIDVFHNGQLLLSGTNSQVGAGEADYFIFSPTQLKFGIDLFADDIVSVVTYTNNNSTSAPAAATYLVVTANSDLDNERVITAGTGLQSTDGGAGGNFTIKLEKELVFNEVLGGNANGSNTYFTFANTPFSSNDVSVFVNGQLQVPNDKASYQDYSVTGSHLYFTTGSTPELGSLVMAIYNKVVT